MGKEQATVGNTLLLIIVIITITAGFMLNNLIAKNICKNKLDSQSPEIIQLQKNVENLKKYNNFIVGNKELISDNQEQLIVIQSKVFKKEIQKAIEILNKTKIPYYALISAEEGQVVFEGDNFGVEVVVKTDDEVVTIR